MASMVQYGRRRGSSKKVSSAEEASRMIQPPDLRQVTVLTKGEWRRIQDELNQIDKDKESMREAAKHREALHLQSKEVVKLWSNTIACERQKMLEAKKIREEIEEEKRKLTDKEEAEYREQQRKDAIEKAKTQLFYQTYHVKGLHSALLLTEVLKERDTQIELKQRIKNASQDVDKVFLDVVKAREDEASRREQEKALHEKLESRAVAEEWKNQIKENELMRERQKTENKKDEEEIRRLQELHQQEQRMEQERQAKLKSNLMQAHLEHVTTRDLIRVTDVQKEKAEEEQRELFLSAKRKMMKLRKDKVEELFRDAQMQRERVMNKLIDTQQDQSDREEQRVAKDVAERDAKRAQQQREEREKKAAMLESIAAHREFTRQQKEQRDKTAEQDNRDRLQGMKEADRIYSEIRQQKAQKTKEDLKQLNDFNATQMAKKSARQQQLTREEHEYEVKNAELVAEEEKWFQQYSEHVIGAAADAQRNVFPLCKALGEGIGGGHCPVTSYLVHDRTGARLPKYVTGTTQNIKKLNEVVDIQEAKARLGFKWS